MLKDRSMKKLFIFMLVIFMAFSSQVFAATEQASDSAAVSGDKKEEVHEVARVEVTGSRLADDISEVPAPAYVITREEIEMSGALSTQDVLNRVPGVNGLKNNASSTQDKYVVVRGLATEVLLLVDGIPFGTSSYGAGIPLGSRFDLRTVPLESIERIEVVKGASSAIYGSHAAGGVINIITKKGIDKSGGTLLLEGGSHGWFRGSVRGTAVMSDDLKVTLGYTKTMENSDVNLRKRDDGTYDRATDYRGNDFMLGLEKGKWSFSGAFGDYDSDWESNWNSDVTSNTQKNKYQRFAVSYSDEVNYGRVYYNRNEKKYSAYSPNPMDAEGSELKDSSIGLMFSRKQDIFGLKGVWGFEWRRESSESKGYGFDWDLFDTVDQKAYDLKRDGFSPYFEASMPVGELALDIGLRYEHWNVDDGDTVDELIPRLSLNWESSTGKIWYLTAGRFFSMPSFYQIWCPIRSMGSPNPNLKPEKGWTYDIGIKDPKAANPWSLSIFYMDMEDKINFDWGTGYFNLDEYRAWGVEGEIKFDFQENWSYTQGISWIDAEDKAGGKAWARSRMPRLDLNGRLNYAKGPWVAELDAHYYGDREIGSGTYKDDNDNMFLMNASVSWKGDAYKVVLSCTNIFDKEFVLDSQGYINPERKFVLSWQYEF